MLFLTGLLGMMVLGSVAIVSTGDSDEDTAENASQLDSEAEERQALTDSAAATGPGSLFAQMGIIKTAGNISDGTEGDETLAGTDSTDLLNGRGGNDRVDGAGGDDQIVGGTGSDDLLGGAGNDTLHGEAEADILRGGSGADELYGHDGPDSLYGDDGADILQGGLGSDWLDGGAGADALHGREGDDRLDGGEGGDTLFGGWDNDLLVGVETDAPAQDFLNGGDGDDTLIAGAGDVLSGGEGADTLVLADPMAGTPSQIMDYDDIEDQIVILFDDADGADEPTIDVRMNGDDATLAEIVLDGVVVSTLPAADAPGVEGIVLVPQSAAAQLGFA